jgi:hypothetical protein
LALREVCVSDLPESTFEPGQPENLDPALWQYVSNTLFQGLGSAEGLLKSFTSDDDKNPWKVWENLDAFCWHRFSPDTIMNYLWHGIEDLFIPPPGLTPPDKYKSTSQNRRNLKGRYLTDSEALHIIMICIYALVGSARLRVSEYAQWIGINYTLLNDGHSFAVEMTRLKSTTSEYNERVLGTIEILDAFHSTASLRLASRLVKAIAARKCFYEMEHGFQNSSAGRENGSSEFPLMELIKEELVRIDKSTLKGEYTGRAVGCRFVLIFINWLRMLVLQNWDGQPEVNRWSTAGAAIEILASIGRLTFSISRDGYD